MAAENPRQEDREQAREKLNALRVVGGLLLIVSLLLYFFHLAEARMGQHTMGALAVLFSVTGVVLLIVGRRKLRRL